MLSTFPPLLYRVGDEFTIQGIFRVHGAGRAAVVGSADGPWQCSGGQRC